MDPTPSTQRSRDLEVDKPSYTFEEAKELQKTTEDPQVWALCNTIINLHGSIRVLESICENAQVERDDLRASVR